jgi:hypothetical protein
MAIPNALKNATMHFMACLALKRFMTFFTFFRSIDIASLIDDRWHFKKWRALFEPARLKI